MEDEYKDARLKRSSESDDAGYINKLGYDIEKVLGEGGFGTVYKVCDKNGCNKVIKFFSSDEGEAYDEAKNYELLKRADPEGKYHCRLLKKIECEKNVLCLVYDFCGTDTFGSINHKQKEGTGHVRYERKDYYQILDDYFNLQKLLLEQSTSDDLFVINEATGECVIRVFQHNDITPGNIMYDENKKKFIIIDWGISDYAINYETDHLAFNDLIGEGFGDVDKYDKKAINEVIENTNNIFLSLERLQDKRKEEVGGCRQKTKQIMFYLKSKGVIYDESESITTHFDKPGFIQGRCSDLLSLTCFVFNLYLQTLEKSSFFYSFDMHACKYSKNVPYWCAGKQRDYFDVLSEFNYKYFISFNRHLQHSFTDILFGDPKNKADVKVSGDRMFYELFKYENDTMGSPINVIYDKDKTSEEDLFKTLEINAIPIEISIGEDESNEEYNSVRNKKIIKILISVIRKLTGDDKRSGYKIIDPFLKSNGYKDVKRIKDNYMEAVDSSGSKRYIITVLFESDAKHLIERDKRLMKADLGGKYHIRLLDYLYDDETNYYYFIYDYPGDNKIGIEFNADGYLQILNDYFQISLNLINTSTAEDLVGDTKCELRLLNIGDFSGSGVIYDEKRKKYWLDLWNKASYKINQYDIPDGNKRKGIYELVNYIKDYNEKDAERLIMENKSVLKRLQEAKEKKIKELLSETKTCTKKDLIILNVSEPTKYCKSKQELFFKRVYCGFLFRAEYLVLETYLDLKERASLFFWNKPSYCKNDDFEWCRNTKDKLWDIVQKYNYKYLLIITTHDEKVAYNNYLYAVYQTEPGFKEIVTRRMNSKVLLFDQIPQYDEIFKTAKGHGMKAALISVNQNLIQKMTQLQNDLVGCIKEWIQ